MSNFVYEEYDMYGFKSLIINVKPKVFEMLLDDQIKIIKTPNLIPKSIIKDAGYYDNDYEYILYDTRLKKRYLAKEVLKDYMELKKINDNSVSYEDNESVMFHIKKYDMIRYLNKMNKTELIIKKINSYLMLDKYALRPDLIYSMLLSIKPLDLLNISGIVEIGTVYKDVVNVNDFDLKEMEMFTLLHFDKTLDMLYDKFVAFFKNIRKDIVIQRLEGPKLKCYMKSGYVATIKHNNKDIVIGRLIDRGGYDFKIINDDLKFKRKLDKPKIKKISKIIPNKREISSRYPLIDKDIIRYLSDNRLIIKDVHYVSIKNKLITLTEDMVTYVEEEKLIQYEEYVPNVIELSVNIDRLRYLITQKK